MVTDNSELCIDKYWEVVGVLSNPELSLSLSLSLSGQMPYRVVHTIISNTAKRGQYCRVRFNEQTDAIAVGYSDRCLRWLWYGCPSTSVVWNAQLQRQWVACPIIHVVLPWFILYLAAGWFVRRRIGGLRPSYNSKTFVLFFCSGLISTHLANTRTRISGPLWNSATSKISSVLIQERTNSLKRHLTPNFTYSLCTFCCTGRLLFCDWKPFQSYFFQKTFFKPNS